MEENTEIANLEPINQIDQINEILTFVSDRNTRRAALELLLGFTDSAEFRKLFLQTEVAKTMIRQLEVEDNQDRELILQIIINLSGEESFQEVFIQLNSIFRISTILMKKINNEKDSKEIFDRSNTKNKLDIKLDMEKYIIDSESIKNQSGVLSEIPYYFMILSNLTISEEGQKKFLNMEDETQKGILLMKMLDKFFHHIYNQEFDFCSNLLANVTSFKDGRLLLLEYKIFKIFLIHCDKMNTFKIINLLRIIRNCCFEFESNKDDILVNDAIMFSYLIKILIKNNISDKKILQNVGISHIDEIYFPYFDEELAKSDKETINDLIIDIFLILTNLEEAVTYMKEKCLFHAITQIEDKLTNEGNLKDRLFVIKSYLENSV